MSDRRRRFEELALPHLDAAYNLARWLTRAGPEAEDIVQEALLNAYRGFDSLRGTAVKPWLLAIVRNCYYSSMRRQRPESAPSGALPDDGEYGAGAVEQLVSSDDPERAAIAADTARSLESALATLPPLYREVLLLREVEDLSYREIAGITGTPLGTVMSRLARARTALGRAWHASGAGGPDALP